MQHFPHKKADKMHKLVKAKKYQHPSGGWGSVKAVASILAEENVLIKSIRVLNHQNKPDGFACVSCSWAKPAHPHSLEVCENGVKATAWEITPKRTPPAFFKSHPLKELENWSDHELEAQGRLTAPMRWDANSDCYLEVSWEEAFADIGAKLKVMDPKSAVFYTSGRASLETSYMYQLMVRMYGCNNLPDSSNMCHESTSVALPKSIGVGVGTVILDDFEHADCLFFFGQNVGTNSPRMLHLLQEARFRGAPIITFNPLREPGLVSFANPLSIPQMLTNEGTQISTQYLQVIVGGDIAAITGLCKVLIELDDEAISNGYSRVLDNAFINEHTHGFEPFAEFLRTSDWQAIEQESGLTREALAAAAQVYAKASAVIGVYGMGLTQHRRGVQNVQMVANFLLLKGNIGKPGAGICPVRGHSNVQGQRTVGITEKPELAPLDQLSRQFNFSAPRNKGLNTVETCEGVLNGSVQAFIGLGGNFIRAVPETALMEAAWRKIPLTVQIATKLNRSHVIHGKVAYLLPCLGRIEIDRQLSGEQAVSMEDSTGCMHGSKGVVEPASLLLRSEPAIVAGLANALFGKNSAVNWDAWVGNYDLIRSAIAITYPEIFCDFTKRMWTPGGFHRPVAARHRHFETDTGKANFIIPSSFDENPDMASNSSPDNNASEAAKTRSTEPALFNQPNKALSTILRLTTIRSDDQFNTTIYSLNDRFRSIYGTRMVIFMHQHDMVKHGFNDGDMVTVTTVANDGITRQVKGLKVVTYDIPAGCVAGYFPECNPLIPLWHYAEGSKVPAAKSIPVQLNKVRAT